MRFALLLCLTLTLAGCGPEVVTRENFEKSQPGMTRAEVDAILGPGGSNYQQGIVTWQSGTKKNITVIFDDRKMVSEKTMEGL